MLQSSIRQLYEKYGERLNINLMSVYPQEDKKQIPWDFIKIVSLQIQAAAVYCISTAAVLYKVFHFVRRLKDFY